jgi:hypothetical protein
VYIILNGFFICLLAFIAIGLGVYARSSDEATSASKMGKILQNLSSTTRVHSAVQPPSSSMPDLHGYVTVTGEGKAKKQAKEDGLRQAVLQGVGAYISVDSCMGQFRLIKDEVVAKSAAYVDLIEVFGTVRTEGAWQVKIRCRVQAVKILQRIESDANLAKFITRRAVVVIPETQDNAPKMAGHRQMAAKMEEFLVKKGWKLYIQDMAEATFEEVASEFKPQLSVRVYEKILKLPTDFVILLDVDSRESQGKSKLKVKAMVRNRIGTPFATFVREYDVNNIHDLATWEEAVNQCAPKVNALLYQILLHQSSKQSG